MLFFNPEFAQPSQGADLQHLPLNAPPSFPLSCNSETRQSAADTFHVIASPQPQRLLCFLSNLHQLPEQRQEVFG
jgi:hypothetical protein